MNYMGITPNSIVDGPGNRVVLWVAGCTLNCPGCHNPESHDFNAGKEFDSDAMDELIDKLTSSHVDGLTISGGHPFERQNLERVHEIVVIAKMMLNKNIWIYTGYQYEDIIKDPKILEILKLTDVVVDGRFDINQRDITLAFRGSKNQRIIDVKQSLEYDNTVVLNLDVPRRKFKKYI